MLISVINFTRGKVTDEELQRVVRAVNRQISEDFEPYWSMGARLRVDGRSVATPNAATFEDLRGDAIIYVTDTANLPGALGFHDLNFSGVPFGFVFTDLAQQLGESWTVTLSHEALELIGDPDVNLLVIGPHPDPLQNRFVFHWYEMSDAVQSESYFIDGVEVSNFVLPLYFTGTRDTDEIGARNDFLGRTVNGATLSSFGVKPGGYVGFFDPETGQMETFAAKGDVVAQKRLSVKKQLAALKDGQPVSRAERHLDIGFKKSPTVPVDAAGLPAPTVPVKDKGGKQPTA